jgi:hypothetical protein
VTAARQSDEADEVRDGRDHAVLTSYLGVMPTTAGDDVTTSVRRPRVSLGFLMWIALQLLLFAWWHVGEPNERYGSWGHRFEASMSHNLAVLGVMCILNFRGVFIAAPLLPVIERSDRVAAIGAQLGTSNTQAALWIAAAVCTYVFWRVAGMPVLRRAAPFLRRAGWWTQHGSYFSK